MSVCNLTQAEYGLVCVAGGGSIPPLPRFLVPKAARGGGGTPAAGEVVTAGKIKTLIDVYLLALSLVVCLLLLLLADRQDDCWFLHLAAGQH